MAAASCPTGSLVTGGGFTLAAEMQVLDSSRDGMRWIVEAINNADESKSLNAYAICLFNASGESTSVAKQVEVPAFSSMDVKVSCPGYAQVSAGGFYLDTDMKIVDSSKKNNGWQAIAYNNSGESKLLTVIANCISGLEGEINAYSVSSTVAGNSTAASSAYCPQSAILTGGGFNYPQGLRLLGSSPLASGWQNWLVNPLPSDQVVDTYAICYTP